MKLNELVAKMSMTCAVKIELYHKPEDSEIVYEKSAYKNSIIEIKPILQKYGTYLVRFVNIGKNFINDKDYTYEEPYLHICISETEEL